MSDHVVLQGLGKTFAGGGGVRDVELTIARGEFIAIVGPSGCGKSTLLELITGLQYPDQGRILIDSEDVTAKSPSERGVALVFQSYALYPHLDVRRNIAFPLENARVPKPEIATRVTSTAERLAIGHLLDRKPKDLSGGERQRVALARAIVREPRVCLFDEPLSNLDPSLRARMRAEIKALHREMGATFVWVTHDQAEAMTLADRVVVLSRGQVRQVGAPAEVYARPDDTFVASFFGSPPINLLREGDETIGVRPEDVQIADEVSPGSPAAQVGRVVLVEPLGAETWVSVALEGDVTMTGRAAKGSIPALGARAAVRFAPEARLRFGVDGRRTHPPRGR